MPKLQVSKRGQNVIASPIRKFLPFVMATEKKGIKVIKINVGTRTYSRRRSFLKSCAPMPAELALYPIPGNSGPHRGLANILQTVWR